LTETGKSGRKGAVYYIRIRTLAMIDALAKLLIEKGVITVAPA